MKVARLHQFVDRSKHDGQNEYNFARKIKLFTWNTIVYYVLKKYHFHNVMW